MESTLQDRYDAAIDLAVSAQTMHAKEQARSAVLWEALRFIADAESGQWGWIAATALSRAGMPPIPMLGLETLSKTTESTDRDHAYRNALRSGL